MERQKQYQLLKGIDGHVKKRPLIPDYIDDGKKRNSSSTMTKEGKEAKEVKKIKERKETKEVIKKTKEENIKHIRNQRKSKIKILQVIQDTTGYNIASIKENLQMKNRNPEDIEEKDIFE